MGFEAAAHSEEERGKNWAAWHAGLAKHTDKGTYIQVPQREIANQAPVRKRRRRRLSKRQNSVSCRQFQRLLGYPGVVDATLLQMSEHPTLHFSPPTALRKTPNSPSPSPLQELRAMTATANASCVQIDGAQTTEANDDGIAGLWQSTTPTGRSCLAVAARRRLIDASESTKLWQMSRNE